MSLRRGGRKIHPRGSNTIGISSVEPEPWGDYIERLFFHALPYLAFAVLIWWAFG